MSLNPFRHNEHVRNQLRLFYGVQWHVKHKGKRSQTQNEGALL